jgi:hypothetical protein
MKAMRRYFCLTIFALMALLVGQICHANEPISGWGAVRFGMSRAEVRKATTSEISNCEDGTAPLECQSEFFVQTIGGLEWYVDVYFMKAYGASKIKVWSFDLGSEALELFDQYKRSLSTKYGNGTESSLRLYDACSAAQQLLDQGKIVVSPLLTRVRTATKFVILGDGGTIVMLLTKESLCQNAPAKARLEHPAPTYSLELFYRKRDSKLPDAF